MFELSKTIMTDNQGMSSHLITGCGNIKSSKLRAEHCAFRHMPTLLYKYIMIIVFVIHVDFHFNDA